MAKEYTQTVKPVSRIAEKIFGWIGWLLLLLLTAGILFFSLVTMNDQATIDDFTTIMEQQMQNMDLQGVDPQAVIDMSLASLSSLWGVALYLVLPLIIALLALLNMKRRILAGILLLIAAILAAPLVVTLLSSLFFVIAAILLFARKDLVVKNDFHMDDTLNDSRNVRNDEAQHRVMTPPVEDDVKVRNERNSDYNYNDKDSNTNDDDIESTRKFQRIDEYDDTTAVDDNIDSQNIDRPVTDGEYKYKNGVELEDLNDLDKENPAQTRRDNVDRRNRK